MAGQLPGGAGGHSRPRPLPGHPAAHGAQEELIPPSSPEGEAGGLGNKPDGRPAAAAEAAGLPAGGGVQPHRPRRHVQGQRLLSGGEM